jgi:hypothetical protein
MNQKNWNKSRRRRSKRKKKRTQIEEAQCGHQGTA